MYIAPRSAYCFNALNFLTFMLCNATFLYVCVWLHNIYNVLIVHKTVAQLYKKVQVK